MKESIFKQQLEQAGANVVSDSSTDSILVAFDGSLDELERQVGITFRTVDEAICDETVNFALRPL